MGRTDSRLRLLVLLVTFVVLSGMLVVRAAYWQVVRGAEMTELADAQTTVRMEMPARRGEIYDRTGTILLATSVERERLVAATDELTPTQRRETGDRLVELLELDEAAAATLRERLASGRPYVILARGIDPGLADRVRAAARDRRLTGITLEPEPERVYPQPGGAPDTTLAAHLLGFVNREGEGQYGVERYYQSALAGEPRIVVAERDVNGRPLLDTALIESPGVAGEDIRLTIDAGLQLSLEEELLAAALNDGAKSVSAVVMDPYTGEIYAMATYPSYDANRYAAIAAEAPQRFIDPNVSSVYEPGSVLKMMTAASALEAGTVERTTRIKDAGTLRLDGGRTKIDNADRRSMGTMTFEDGIAYSRNVIATKVAMGLGPDTATAAATLHDTWLDLGLGALTGIDVAGEVRGLVRDPAITPWREIDLANASFGQGVAVTPIQLAASFAAMTNGGTLLAPRVVGAVGEIDTSPRARGQVLGPATSTTLIDMMANVIDEVEFYRDRTLVPGYYVGGKTGTAQIWDPARDGGRGGWKDNLFNYSFVGYVGRDPEVPDLIVSVRIEEGRPTIARVGQLEMPVMSFELFQRIATNAMATPDLLPDRQRALPPVPDDR
ncbi:MAG: peptidoglycan D,D-transpeptidase FtsI family protein [Candidatus Limnocylindria bacterium]